MAYLDDLPDESEDDVLALLHDERWGDVDHRASNGTRGLNG